MCQPLNRLGPCVDVLSYTLINHFCQADRLLLNTTPNKSEQKRAEIIAGVAQHLLVHGFRDSGIRALASSVGISDRMLMYYFETKDLLISEAMMSIAAGLQEGLDALVPAKNATGAQILETLVAAGRSDEVKPLLRLFFEVVGRAMRNEEPYRTTAQLILRNWRAWLESKLRAEQRHRVDVLMAQLEGQLMIDLLMDDAEH